MNRNDSLFIYKLYITYIYIWCIYIYDLPKYRSIMNVTVTVYLLQSIHIPSTEEAAAPGNETCPCPRRGMGRNASIPPAEKIALNSNSYNWLIMI